MYLVPKSIEDLNRQLSTSVGFDSFFNRLFDDAFIREVRALIRPTTSGK